MLSIAQYIKGNEGCPAKVYRDTNGELVYGWGVQVREGMEVVPHIAEAFFIWYTDRVITPEYLKLGFELEDELARKTVIYDMLMMGLPKFKMFKQMIAAVHQRDWRLAAWNICYTKMPDGSTNLTPYFRDLTDRALKNHDMMLTGERVG